MKVVISLLLDKGLEAATIYDTEVYEWDVHQFLHKFFTTTNSMRCLAPQNNILNKITIKQLKRHFQMYFECFDANATAQY